MRQVSLIAYAKVNLSLRVLGKRADGFHNIHSVMHSVSLFDVVKLKVIPKGIVIKCGIKDVPLDHTNTAYKAAEEFFKEMPKAKTDGVEIVIEKNIPIGAGLAGGSADAAAVLEGLNQLFSTNYSLSKLQGIGLRVGSDVPFCLVGGRALVSGRGEKIEPHEVIEKKWLVLINPGYEVSTRWVYAELDRVRGAQKPTTKELENEQYCNDLELITAAKHSEVLKIKEVLQKLGAELALMTGSGPTVFGVFSDKSKAERVFEEVVSLYPRTFIADFVDRGVKLVN